MQKLKPVFALLFLLTACSNQPSPVGDAEAPPEAMDLGQEDSESIDEGQADGNSFRRDAGPPDSGDPNSFVLWIRVDGGGVGRIEDGANGIDCESTRPLCSFVRRLGTTFELNPVAEAGSRFSHWNDSICGPQATEVCSLAVDTNTDLYVNAVFRN